MSPGPRRTAEEEDDDEDLGGEALRALLEATRTSEGRSRLASEGIVLPKLVRRLRPDLPSTASSPSSGQDAFLESGGPEAAASVVLRGALPVPEEVVRLGLQLLGNVAAAGERHRSTVWRQFFSDGFLDLARVRDAMACDALCMILYMCCCSSGPESRERFDELCGVGRGLPILKEVISTACSEFSSFSFVEICRLPENGNPPFTVEQAFLLGILSDFLSEQPGEGGHISRGFVLAVLRVLEGASLSVDFSSRGPSPLPTGSPAVDALGYSLAILRDIAAADDSSSLPPLVEPLVSSGICRHLLGLLRDLEPPSTVRRALHRRPSSEAASPPSSPSKVCPYRGFRRDLVAVIGNCTCGRRRVQDEIRQLDGILLLLQQCVVDEENPYLREWGMLAVSYLLEGNAENQRLVAELELQGSVDTPEVAELGLRVDLDKKTGRVKLVNV
ncbi:unnamed protein product [Spirodela intermedia]|uniref:Ataxin-10 domain-containing protein n=1 Tax=Spirodela intermedia TaxID=51605 RepID=A0A7I8JII3_SPIIN|nr:unnamed protein product [Spirodela intermedia]CAA6669565.1 unnamed protein product [Spirodela intermedia]